MALSPDDRVYFVHAVAAGLIKIGIACDVFARLETLQSQTGDELRLLAHIPGGRPRERELHAKFAADRIRGEWFRPTPALLDLIGQHMEVGLPPAYSCASSPALFPLGPSFLVGHRYAGKTNLALQIANDLANGEETMLDIQGPTGDSLYLFAGQSELEIRERLERIPSRVPSENLSFVFDFPPFEAGGYEYLLDLVKDGRNERLVVLDDWHTLTGSRGGHTGMIQWLRSISPRYGVKFLVLYSARFSDFRSGGDTSLSIVGSADCTLFLRSHYRKGCADLIVTAPDLRGMGYLIQQDRRTEFWRQVGRDPRPMLLEERWWELQP